MDDIRQRLLAIVARFGLPAEAREDVTHDALVRLLKARTNGEPLRNECAFAVRIAVNLAIDRIRQRQRSDASLSLLAARAAAAAGDDVDRLDRPPEVDRLYAAIRRLPPKQAAAVTLRELLELEFREIASILGTSEATCRSLCRHGRQGLREMMCHTGDRPAIQAVGETR